MVGAISVIAVHIKVGANLIALGANAGEEALPQLPLLLSDSEKLSNSVGFITDTLANDHMVVIKSGGTVWYAFGQITLHYGSDGKVQDAQVGSPEYFRSMGEEYIYSALQSGAIAAGWEVQTAKTQSQLGDPMAGLTEVQRAQRSNQYLGASHLTSTASNGNLGTWRVAALDLNGDGIQTVSEQTSGVVFDVDGTGFGKQTAWVGKQDGMLVLDRNFNGVIDSGSELFGNTQVALGAQGLKGLAWVDVNVDGNIDSQDAVYSQLRVWQDANGNGLVDNGEAKKLTDLGISSIHYNRGSFLGAKDYDGKAVVFSYGEKLSANDRKYQITANFK